MPTIDLGALAPADVIYKNVPGSNGPCELILSGALPLRDIVEGLARASEIGSLYSADNIEYLKKCFKLKTDPEVVEDAFKHLNTAHFKRFNEDVTNIITMADSTEIEDVKKKGN